jgi:hypothetical protein
MYRRHVALVALVGSLVVVGTGTAAQQASYPVFEVAHLVGTMKTLGPNFMAIDRSLADQDYATAKERITRAREQLSPTVTFWRDRERNDAISFLQDAVTRMDALDAALSVDTVDAGVVTALAREIGAACRACHEVYRDQDPVTQEYRLKLSAAGQPSR